MANHGLVPQPIFAIVLSFYALPITIRYKKNITNFLCCPVTDSWHSIALKIKNVACVAFAISVRVQRFTYRDKPIKEWKPHICQETDSFVVVDIRELWEQPRLTIEELSEFIEQLPWKHKEKIWARHATGQYIAKNKILNMLHSFLALVSRLKIVM
eukprot:33033_1